MSASLDCPCPDCLISDDLFSSFSFVNSEKRTQVLPHMPPDRRKFVHDVRCHFFFVIPFFKRVKISLLASGCLQDGHPNGGPGTASEVGHPLVKCFLEANLLNLSFFSSSSVQLLRRSDTRTPSPLLSTYIATTTAPPASLGKLADLRAMRGAAASTSSSASSSSWRVAGSGNGSAGLSSSSSSRPVAPVVGQRGWASVIAQQAGVLPAAAVMVDRPLSTPLIGGSGTGSRTASPVPLPLPAESGPLKNVPDSWEDDA